MYRVLADFTAQYDYRLIILVLLFCATASALTFAIYSRGLRNGHNPVWFVLAGVCVSVAMWGLHNIEMLFLQRHTGFLSQMMVNPLSLFISIAFASAGFLIARAGEIWKSCAGGLLISIGIAALHFSGLASLILPGKTAWDGNIAVSAVIAGALLSACALIAYHRLDRLMAVIASCTLFAFAIGALHFLVIAAQGGLPNLASSQLQPFVDRSLMSIIAAGAIGLAAGSMLVGLWLQVRSKFRTDIRTRELVDAALDGLVVARQGRIVSVNRRLTQLCSMSEKELIGKQVFGDLFDAPSPRTALAESFTADMRMKVKGGSDIPVEVALRPLSQSATNQSDEIYAIRDLREWNRAADALRRVNTELKQREEELRTQNIRFDVALNNMSQGLSMFDANQRLVVCNEQYARIYGMSQEDVQPGSSLKAILQARIQHGAYSGSPESYIKERLQSVANSEEVIQILNDGRMVAVKRSIMPDGGWVSTHEDITDKRRVEARIAYLAQHDPLTNLANRAYLTEQLDKNALLAADGKSAFAVVMLDLDRFKEVNDTLGHFVGDGLLRSVADRLRNCVRKTATLARFGGDEFAILEQTSDPDVEASALAKRILASLREPFEIEGHIVSTGTSIGIAVAPRDSNDPDELLKCADLALYQAKAEARGTYRFYDAQMKKRMEERRALEHDLRLALSRGEFSLHYQAIVDAASSQITGFEALIRWEHPERGRVPPDRFIPIAEETGLINKIGKWVMRRACTEATTWPSHFKVAVNLSVKQFKSPGLVPSVAHVLMDTGLEPHRLELEITESVMLKDAEDAFITLGQLHDLGVRISLDDFGTGFSTLSYLRRFHFDKIKIDRSFIRDLSTGDDALVIVRSILALGKGLGITTTAEGVETKEQLDIMRNEGCTEIQGYYFSPPLPSDEIRSLFETPPESLAHNVA